MKIKQYFIISLLSLTLILHLSCKNKDADHYYENKHNFIRLQKIFSENYDNLKKLDNNKFHNNLSLYEKDFMNNYDLLNTEDMKFLQNCFEQKIFYSVNIYDKNCISFIIEYNSGYLNGNINYVVYSRNINDFIENKSSYSTDIINIDSLELNWYYIKRRTSLAN